MKRILVSLTYYRPHISGLTIYVQRLVEAWVKRGYKVTLLTSRFNSHLAREENYHGVKVVRVPVQWRLNKGVLMLTYPWQAAKLLGEHDFVHLHLPSLEALILALLARLKRKKVITTYHCDLQLPRFPGSRFLDQVIRLSHCFTLALSNVIVAYTEDFAQHSQLLPHFYSKIKVIIPPVIMPLVQKKDLQAWQKKVDWPAGTVIGMAARFAEDKGIEYLLKAIPLLLKKFPDLKIVFAGEYRQVVGENRYRERLQPLLTAYRDHIKFFGILPQTEMPFFYHSLDCLVVASINSTESFGLVQVEAMLCGTPVVATNLPGVRQPIQLTGMGEVVKIGDSRSLAAGIIKVLTQRKKYLRPRTEIEQIFSLSKTLEGYDQLFN